MQTLTRILSDADRSYLIRIASPQARDTGSLHRALREDEDILLGMLRDPKLLRHLLGQPERLAAASPRLFFAVLLLQVRAELSRTSYTTEEASRHHAVIFDGKAVSALMDRPDILAYFVEMLASFLRVRTQSLVVRVRKGMWSRLSYNDTDLESLMDWGRYVGPDEQFALWRRIGDVCLFRAGLYPSGSTASTAQDLAEVGRRYYGLASRRREAQEAAITETLEELGRRFETAVKPLALLGSRYLEALRDRIFAV